MKKNVLFFLWLVIGTNVFSMEGQDEKNISEENSDVTETLRKLSEIFSVLSEKFKNNYELPKINATKIPSVLVGIPLDVKKEVITLAEVPDVIITTEWATFKCREDALNWSKFFEAEIAQAKKKEGENLLTPIKVTIPKADASYFELMLRMLHKQIDFEKQEISPRQYLKFLHLSQIIYKCDDKIIEILKTHVRDRFSRDEITKSLDGKKFDDHRDIYFLQEVLPYLPSWAMEYFLKTPRFKTDSENTLLYFLVSWAEKQNKAVALDIASMLHHIRWQEIKLEYLVTVVRDLVYKHYTPQFAAYYRLAISMKLAKYEEDGPKMNALLDKINAQAKDLNYSLDLEPHQKSFKTEETFAMKTKFRKVSEWEMGAKYYSKPIIWNGYAWYFFMRAERSEDTGLSYLAGYLRAVGVGTGEHYLNVTRKIAILEKNGKKRELPPVTVEFNHYDRSVGSPINLTDAPVTITLRSQDISHEIRVEALEVWEDQIRRGKSAVVIDDSITLSTAVMYEPPSDKKIKELIDEKIWQLDDEKLKKLTCSAIPVAEEIEIVNDAEQPDKKNEN